MFDKLEGLVDRLDTVLQELNDPDVAGNQNRFRDLMKEQNELTPIVEKYKESIRSASSRYTEFSLLCSCRPVLRSAASILRRRIGI